MANKKAFTLKCERSDTILSTPKTPMKRTPYKDMFANGENSNYILADPIADDIFGTKDQNKECDFLYKIGEGDFYDVYVRKANVLKNHVPLMVYKNKRLCLSDIDCTAVKKSRNVIRNELERKSFMNEVEILKKIKDNNVTKYIDTWESMGHLYIEVEYCNLGTLRDYMNRIYYHNKSRFSKQFINKMMLDLSQGLLAIHKLSIVHLDIKPENIFLKSANNALPCTEKCQCEYSTSPNSIIFKIGDFNISRHKGEEIINDGDKRYMAPEVLDNVCTPYSDIYSLGLIYLEVVREIILPKSGRSWLRLRKNNFRGIKIDKLTKSMLDMEYTKRLSAEEVIRAFSK